MMRVQTCLATVLLGLSATMLTAHTQQTSTIAQRVDAYVETEMAKQRIPGLALGVYRNGEVLATRGYGVADIKTRIPVTPDTIFQSGSVGKQFTAVAVMMLVEEGKLGLVDSIAPYFPDAPGTWKAITIQHLLSHTSGLHEYFVTAPINVKKNYTPAQLLKIIEAYPLDFQPGEAWGYRNTNYALLGFVIETITGKFWGDFVQDRIFTPLGMKSTKVISQARNVPNRSAGYQIQLRVFPLIGIVQNKVGTSTRMAPIFDTTADGALNFTVVDLAKWDAALDTERLLKRSSIERMWTVANLKDGTPNPGRYGFGWSIQSINGNKVVQHSGGTSGFTTHMARYGRDKVTVAVLTNLEGRSSKPQRIADAVAGMYDPSLAGPELKPIPDSDPQATAIARTLIRNLASGKAPEGMPRDVLKKVHDYLKYLGSIKAMDLVKREGGNSTYRVTFDGFDCLVEINLDADNKPTGISIRD